MSPKKKKQLSTKQVHLITKALADPRRYDILKYLGRCVQPIACGSVRACTEISPATLSHHMKELETAGLVEPVREGKFVSYVLQRQVLEAFLETLRSDLI